MDVGLDLRNLRATGRLAAFHAEVGVATEQEAIGILADVWHTTQDAEIVTATIDELRSVLRVVLRGRDIPAILRAMAVADLADDHGDKITIRGNEAHVAKLAAWRLNAARGGQARAKQLAAKRQPSGTPWEPNVSPGTGSGTGSGSGISLDHYPRDLDLLEAANAEVEQRPDLTLEQKALSVRATRETGVGKGKPRGTRSESLKEAARRVAEAFKAGYHKRYQRELTAWGAPQNSHVYHLLKTWPVEELEALAARYFEWANKDAIDGGHAFMGAKGSFSAKLYELKADLVAPERRKVSAIVHERQKQADHSVTVDDQAARVAAQLREKHAHRQDPRVDGAADAAPRNLLATNHRPSVGPVGREAFVTHRAGARPSDRRGDDGADDAEPWRSADEDAEPEESIECATA